MKDFLKTLAVALLSGLVAGAVVSHYSSSVVNQYTTGVGSAAGTTFSTAKVAQVNMTPSTGSATSTAILNPDGFDRVVDSTFYSCTGVGTSLTAYTGAGLTSTGLVITAATSSAALTTPTTNPNQIMANVVSTTTGPLSYLASTTVTILPARIWASGSYMNFQFNATNTAACTVGAYYHGS